ncbi:hypothetical protein PSENEW3_00006257 [Picochlorum sp. SENEW3]|nr:hypothetical protein PSENEW3_00006257 [Picochlorum sp. SENEW3]
MADTRQQADATDCQVGKENTLTVTGCEVTSVTQSSDGVYIEVSGDPCDFTGDVYVHVGGTKVKQSTIERMRRRERQKARQSAAISDAEREARREAQHQEWQARQERQRKETERRWEEREKKEGRKLSKAEHTAKDLEEENASRKKSQRALTSFFKPVVGHVSENVDCNETRQEENKDVSVVETTTERVEERNEEHCAGKKASAFTPGMEVFLRLAFIDSEQVDSMMLKDAKKYIREKGIIGKVIIEEMVERDVARLNLVEFDKLRDFSKRSAGVDVHATHFSKLTEALGKVGGKVNIKYLTKQNRQCGENHKWTDKQIEQVRKAVEEAKERWPDSLYSKAAQSLRARYNGPILGNISSQQVRNVYEQKVLKSNVPRAPVGRPRKKKSSQAAQPDMII